MIMRAMWTVDDHESYDISTYDHESSVDSQLHCRVRRPVYGQILRLGLGSKSGLGLGAGLRVFPEIGVRVKVRIRVRCWSKGRS